MSTSGYEHKEVEKAVQLYLNLIHDNKVDTKKYQSCSKFYAFSNEPTNQLIGFLDLKSIHNVLSVLAGGDFIFSLINQGINEIKTFDINKLTDYYTIGFKKRAIECLSYEQFLELFDYNYYAPYNSQFGTNRELESFVLDNCDDKYKNFWKEYKYLLNQQGYDASVFHLSYNFNFKELGWYKSIDYLNDQETYHNLQKRLLNSKITFMQADITKIPCQFDKFDLIYISNILDYCINSNSYLRDSEAIKINMDLLKRIVAENLTINGEIMLTSIFWDFAKELINNSNLANIVKEYSIENYPRVRAYGIKK